MKFVEAGGVRVSAIGLGTWQFGSKDWGYGNDYAGREAPAIVQRAIELGINFIDTAEAYGGGKSETILGQAIKGHRDEVFVATKLLPVVPLPPIVERHGRKSAQRLGIDAIDLYQIHWPNPLFPIGPQMSGMRKLLDAGVVRHAGVSNFNLGKWQKAQAALGAPVLSNQVSCSLIQRKPFQELVPWAQQHDRIVIAYSPLSQGLLSGKYDSTRRPQNRARKINTLFLPENLARASELIETLRTIAKAHDATPSQVALAWVIRHANVVAIPGASSVAQLEANAAAADLDLSDDDAARLLDAAERFVPKTGPATAPGLVKSLIGR